VWNHTQRFLSFWAQGLCMGIYTAAVVRLLPWLINHSVLKIEPKVVSVLDWIFYRRINFTPRK
jgi:hypothetical protein